MSSRIRKPKVSFQDEMARSSAVIPEGSEDIQVMLLSKSAPKEGKSGYRFLACVIAKEPITLEYRQKREKKDNGEYVNAGGNVDDHGQTSVTLQPYENIWMASFDSASTLANIPTPVLGQASILAKVYNGGPSFTCSNIRFTFALDNDLNYKKYVVGTRVGELPYLNSMLPNEVSKGFILPMYGGNPYYKSTEIANEIDKSDRMQYINGKDEKDVYIGVNFSDGVKAINGLSLNYMGENCSCFIKGGYTRSLFEPFGVVDLENWRMVGPILLSCCKDTFVSGSVTREKLAAMLDNKLSDDEKPKDANGNPCHTSTAFFFKLSVNMVETVMASGLPLEPSYAREVLKNQKFKVSKDSKDNQRHPMNCDWDDKLDRASPTCKEVVNMSELAALPRSQIFSGGGEKDEKGKVIKEPKTVQFWGVFGKDDKSCDELKASDEQTPAKITKMKAVPAVIFAIIM